MTDDVTISFMADISGLRQGLSDATSLVATATGSLKAAADGVSVSFAAMGKAYAAGMAQRLDAAKHYSDDELSVARAGDKAETDSALNAVKLRQAALKEAAQSSLLSHEEERAAALALEAEREDIERRHLTFLQSTYKDNVVQYANVQRQIDELSSQSALRRQEIERSYTREVYADYKRTFEQAGSSVSSSIMGMIKGQETLRQAISNVLLSIIQSFIQARIRSVADWAAGVATQTAATTAGEAAKTAAVTTGEAARGSAVAAGATAQGASILSSIMGSITASAAETFAGIFGFLSPLLGPAAAGPAAAGQASVLAAAAGLPSFDAGAWSLPHDMVAQVHAGEMIVPAGPAAALRATVSGSPGGGQTNQGDLHTHFHVAAMDSRDVRRFFSDNSKHILSAINDGLRTGSHLGLNKLKSPVGA